MSKKSDDHEIYVASSYQNNPFIETASHSRKGVHFADVIYMVEGRQYNDEIKMDKADNLMNTRCFYENGMWRSRNDGPAAHLVLSAMNSCPNTALTVANLSHYTGIPRDEIVISSNPKAQKLDNVVKVGALERYFDEKPFENIVNHYLFSVKGFDVGSLARLHYQHAKHFPVEHINIGDSFYRLKTERTVPIASSVPLLEGIGRFGVRFSLRSKFTEVQPEVKFDRVVKSDFSMLPGTKKKNPFDVSSDS